MDSNNKEINGQQLKIVRTTNSRYSGQQLKIIWFSDNKHIIIQSTDNTGPQVLGANKLFSHNRNGSNNMTQ
jgi:hypothetical protein